MIPAFVSLYFFDYSICEYYSADEFSLQILYTGGIAPLMLFTKTAAPFRSL